MKNFLLAIVGTIIIALGGYYLYNQNYQPPAKRHVHAGFVVFLDGKQQDFSNIKYMSLKPCEDSDAKPTKEEVMAELAHLHDNVGYVAHSHFEGAVWADLFRNMKYQFDQSKQITAYINGKKVDDIFSYPLNAYDSAVIFVGKVDEKLLKKAISKGQIKKVEQTSADCGVNHN